LWAPHGVCDSIAGARHARAGVPRVWGAVVGCTTRSPTGRTAAVAHGGRGAGAGTCGGRRRGAAGEGGIRRDGARARSPAARARAALGPRVGLRVGAERVVDHPWSMTRIRARTHTRAPLVDDTLARTSERAPLIDDPHFGAHR